MGAGEGTTQDACQPMTVEDIQKGIFSEAGEKIFRTPLYASVYRIFKI